MSYVFIVRILTSDPGYLDPKYEHPLVADGMAPLNQLRVYNLRHYQANKLFYEDQDEEASPSLL